MCFCLLVGSIATAMGHLLKWQLENVFDIIDIKDIIDLACFKDLTFIEVTC